MLAPDLQRLFAILCSSRKGNKTEPVIFLVANTFINFGPSGVHALPFAAGINEGGHYFTYIIPLFFSLLTTAIQNHRRGCRRDFKYLHGPLKKIIKIMGKN
jgi:hypothetical protein